MSGSELFQNCFGHNQVAGRFLEPTARTEERRLLFISELLQLHISPATLSNLLAISQQFLIRALLGDILMQVCSIHQHHFQPTNLIAIGDVFVGLDIGVVNPDEQVVGGLQLRVKEPTHIVPLLAGRVCQQFQTVSVSGVVDILGGTHRFVINEHPPNNAIYTLQLNSSGIDGIVPSLEHPSVEESVQKRIDSLLSFLVKLPTSRHVRIAIHTDSSLWNCGGGG